MGLSWFFICIQTALCFDKIKGNQTKRKRIMKVNGSVGVLGAGSLGLLYAACLSHITETTIYTRTNKQAEKINEAGLFLKRKRHINQSFPRALVSSELTNDSIALLFIALKSYQLAELLPRLKELSPKTTLCFLNNGIAHLQYVETLPAETIILATSEHGAVRSQANVVDWRGVGKTNYSYYRSKESAHLDNFLKSKRCYIFINNQIIKRCYFIN